MTLEQVKALKLFLEQNNIKVSGFKALQPLVNDIRASEYSKRVHLEYKKFRFTASRVFDFDVKLNKTTSFIEYHVGHICNPSYSEDINDYVYTAKSDKPKTFTYYDYKYAEYPYVTEDYGSSFVQEYEKRDEKEDLYDVCIDKSTGWLKKAIKALKG